MEINKNQIKKIIFYNNFNHGDIHYSREFIKFFSKELRVPSFVNHKKCPTLLEDTQIPFIHANLYHLNQNGFYFQNGVLFLNTWIGQEGGKWLHQHPSGCNLKNNYKMFFEKAKTLGLKMPDEDHFIPSIDYSFFKTKDVKINSRSILVANGPCLSGQSKNFNMDEVIIRLAEKHPNYSFYTTQKVNTNLKNVIDCNETIGKDKNLNNLNEISYISSFCDIIVGRASGPYCFSHTKQNLWNDKKIYIASCNNESEAYWANLKNYSTKNIAKQLWHNTEKNCDHTEYIEELYQIINSEIVNLLLQTQKD